MISRLLPTFLALLFGAQCRAADMREPLPQVLSEEEFAAMLARVDKALAWFATQQNADGSFRTPLKVMSQPLAILCPRCFRGKLGDCLKPIMSVCWKRQTILRRAARCKWELILRGWRVKILCLARPTLVPIR